MRDIHDLDEAHTGTARRRGWRGMDVRGTPGFAAITAGIAMAVSDLLRPIFPSVDDVACDSGASYAVNAMDLVKFAAIGLAVIAIARLVWDRLSPTGRAVAMTGAIASTTTGLVNAIEHCAHVEALGIAYAATLLVGIVATIWFGLLLQKIDGTPRWMGWVIAVGSLAFMLGAEQGWGRPVDAAAWLAVGAGHLIAPTSPESDTRHHWATILLGGLTLGVGWGAVARLWMRFISTDPEFTWSGTLFIVIGFGVAGLGQAGSYLARRAGLRRSRLTIVRVAGFVSLLPLGMAAGGPMLPVVIVAALLTTHPEWGTWVRVVLGVAILLPVVGIGLIVTDEFTAGHDVAAVAWFALIYTGITWAARLTFAPQRDGWRPPLVLRLVGLVGVAGVVLLGAVLIGNPS